MEENNRQKLQAALADLPQHEPDPKQWNKIEAFLSFEEKLIAELPKMPLHEPKTDLWAKIEQQLEPEKTQKHFNLNAYFRYFSAAAAVLLLLIAGVYVVKRYTFPEVKIAYTEETIPEEKVMPLANEGNIEGIQFIQEQCRQAPEICQKPEFKELKAQLEELEEADKEIKHQIKVFGEDPMLIRNQIKIENLRAEYTKELIQIIIS